MVHLPTVRVGIDQVAVAEVAGSIARFGDRYVERLFTTDEIAYCRAAAPAVAAERFAARFAAKEAAVKALRVGDEGMDWRAIEVRRAPGGWCDLALHGAVARAAARRGIGSLAVSLTHDTTHAAAVVTAVCLGSPSEHAD